jgi:hypothetical protein
MKYALYAFNSEGKHNGPRWIEGADEALKAFVGLVFSGARIMLTDHGDMAVAEADLGRVLYARHALFQAPKGRYDLLRTVPLAERECPFCREVFLPSRPLGEWDAWEREQQMTSCCSDACWERAMGAPKTLRYKVELRAFGDGAIREVKLPARTFKDKPLQEIRTAIFAHGQNDRQPQSLPSVSVGDVIILGLERWIITNTGFEKEPEPVALAYDDRDQT